MVFTANQTTSFFEDPNQMAMPAATRAQLANEGLTHVEDLSDFDEDSLKQVAENLRRPGGRIPDPNINAEPGATIPTPQFIFGAKSQMRLKVAAEAVRYYESVDRELTPSCMQWNTALKSFQQHWTALKERKEETVPDVPSISKSLAVTKWTEAFQDFLNRVIGTRMIPLSYVIRENDIVPAAPPALATNQPYSTQHGSVEGELIARASHAHPLYRDDNAKVYYYLEEATRSTSYAASIKPFQRRKGG